MSAQQKAARQGRKAGRRGGDLETGKFREVLLPVQEALRIRRKALGLPEDPATATSLADLAMYFVGGGDFAASLPLSQQLLEIRRKILGPEHPDTVSRMERLGYDYTYLGDYGKALPLLEQALESAEDSCMQCVRPRRRTLEAPAQLYEYRRQFAKALPLRQSAAEIRRENLGTRTPRHSPEHRASRPPLRPDGKLRQRVAALSAGAGY